MGSLLAFGSMPTYSYKCTECQHSFDRLQSINEESLTQCPECKGKVQRMIGAGAGIVFKGSGFYVTDYKNKSESKSEAKSSSSASSTTTATSSPSGTPAPVAPAKTDS